MLSTPGRAIKSKQSRGRPAVSTVNRVVDQRLLIPYSLDTSPPWHNLTCPAYVQTGILWANGPGMWCYHLWRVLDILDGINETSKEMMSRSSDIPMTPQKNPWREEMMAESPGGILRVPIRGQVRHNILKTQPN